MFWIGLIVGLFLGANIGLLVFGLISSSGTKKEMEGKNE